MDQINNFPGVSAIANYLVGLIPREIDYICSYEKNLKELETKVQRLKGTEDSVQHRVDEAVRNAETIEDVVQNWQKEAKDTVDEANKLIDMEAGYCLGQCPNLWTRNRLSRKFEEMTQKISHVIANGNFNKVSYRVPSEVTIMPFCTDYQTLDSRTLVLNEIKQALEDPKIYKIGVYGMGGVGKTTLVNELACQVKKDGSFGAVVIATITHSPDVKDIQDQIADALDQKLEKKTKGGRAGELSQRIRQEKNVLIILDDIWRELDLAEVGIPFDYNEQYNGCKLVVTSRDLNLLKMMGTEEEFYLRALPEKDSWILFKKMAGDVVEEFNIKPIAAEVAKCCAGLPLSIVTVAKGLRKKNVTAWKDALFQLKRFDQLESQRKVYHTLQLSFNWLESDELQSLFLFISSFGLNNIHPRDLFLYCWGFGFYDHLEGTLTDARNRHDVLINNLIASSLLLEGELKYVRMHDIVYAMAKSLAPWIDSINFNYMTKYFQWPMEDHLTTCRYLIIPGAFIYQFPEKLECPKLELLVLRNLADKIKVPDNIFFGMKNVRILDLHRMEFTPSLPPSLDILKDLRSLNLYECNLGDIRIVEKLKKLEILNLEWSSIEELPKEIGHLTLLRSINLANCFRLRVIPKNLISSLVFLEELYMRGCNIQWEVEGSESESKNASLGELRNLHRLKTLEISIQDTSVLSRDLQFLAKLERYNIIFGCKREWSSSRWSSRWLVGARETSRRLKLTDSWWTSISLTTVEELTFAKLKSVEDVLYELNKKNFLQLKYLRIQDSDELLHIINSTVLVNPHSAFPNLEILVLLNLNNMKEICHGPLPTQSFAKLKVIKVEDCHSLENLLSYSLVRNLSQLHEMEIYNCNYMTEIIAKGNQEDEEELLEIAFLELHHLTLNGLPKLLSFYLPLIVDEGNPSIENISLALFNQQVVMPKLETLTLYEINTCKIWDDNFSAHSCIQNLTTLEVSRCGRLTSLFSSLVSKALVQLQLLKIQQCSMLKEIFVQEEEVEFPNLETLGISDLNALKSIWPNQLAPNSFCKLKQIYIVRCDSLDYVFPTFVAKELRHLQVLEVVNCDIKNVVEQSDSGSCDIYIEKLCLINCPNMKTILPSSVLFKNLDEIELNNCSGVVNIITPSTIKCLPKLRILRISQCDELEEICGSRNEDDAPPDEIVFTKLEKLRLRYLPRLTSFCQGGYDFKFQSLRQVHLFDCPMMQTFSHRDLTTPCLTKVQYGRRGKEDHWNGDLNTTIRTIFTGKNPKQDMGSTSESKGE